MGKRIVSLLVAALVCLTAVAGLDHAESADSTAPGSPAASIPLAEAEPVPAGRDWLGLDTSTVPPTGISLDVLSLAVGAVRCAVAAGDIERPPTLTVIDYSLPSVEPRLWVFDTRTGEVLFHELVAHGRNTGENMATRFSDAPNSRQSSIGLFVTASTYVGRNGYSLRLDGLEPGFNGHARERAIVMHGAPYVDQEMALRQGRLGRSWGCPALREAVARDVIDTIRGGGVIFSYYPDDEWLASSRYLNECGAGVPPVLAAD